LKSTETINVYADAKVLSLIEDLGNGQENRIITTVCTAWTDDPITKGSQYFFVLENSTSANDEADKKHIACVIEKKKA
jgi:hypothetical protein